MLAKKSQHTQIVQIFHFDPKSLGGATENFSGSPQLLNY